MNKTEKVVLEQIINNLDKATVPGFDNADYDNWVMWARRMRTVIKTSISILSALNTIESEEKEEYEEEK